jgi:thiol-disulfide isomerase/thioredoxin
LKKLNSRTLLNVVFIGFMSILLVSCSTAESVDNSQQLESEVVGDSSTTQNTDSSRGNYVSYQNYEQEVEKYKDSRVVMFFNASWCSTCKIARDNFESSLDQIPSDLTIVVVDFDNSDDLRKKYGITVQHTLVQIDANGESLKKWSGSTTIDQIVKALV